MKMSKRSERDKEAPVVKIYIQIEKKPLGKNGV